MNGKLSNKVSSEPTISLSSKKHLSPSGQKEEEDMFDKAQLDISAVRVAPQKSEQKLSRPQGSGDSEPIDRNPEVAAALKQVVNRYPNRAILIENFVEGFYQYRDEILKNNQDICKKFELFSDQNPGYAKHKRKIQGFEYQIHQFEKDLPNLLRRDNRSHGTPHMYEDCKLLMDLATKLENPPFEPKTVFDSIEFGKKKFRVIIEEQKKLSEFLDLCKETIPNSPWRMV